MAYRQVKRERPIKRVLQDMTTRNRTMVQNGATAYLAVPCWYQEIRRPQHTHVHDREWHDHIGWPSPGRPDASSQDAYLLNRGTLPYMYDKADEGWMHPGRYLDLSQFAPIHLLAEGYTDVEVAFDDPPEGLTGSGRLDPDSDWVVRFLIHPMCEAAVKEDVDVPYAVFVKGNVGGRPRRDVVARGTLRILAGPIGE